MILDEYVKNRDVWKCPSSKQPAYPAVIMYDPGGNWFKRFSSGEHFYGACCDLWPVGWGGTATDTDQNVCAAGQKPGSDTNAVEFGIAMFEHLQGQSLSVIHDVSRHVVVNDAINTPWWGMVEQLAYPDICRVRWGGAIDYGCAADWTNCSDTQDCGVDLSQINKFWSDPTYRSKYARHLGGSNIGFADGHAKWWPADAIVAAAGNYNNPNPYAAPILGSGRESAPGGGAGTEFLEGINCQCLPQSMWK